MDNTELRTALLLAILALIPVVTLLIKSWLQLLMLQIEARTKALEKQIDANTEITQRMRAECQEAHGQTR